MTYHQIFNMSKILTCVLLQWLLFNAKQAIFSRYLCENKLQFYEIDDDDVRFVLDQHAELEFYIVLAHWNNSPRVYMSLYLDILTRFQANKFMLLNL